MCKEGRPRDHGSERRSSRRDFLKAFAATGAAAGLTLLNTNDASARNQDDDAPEDNGRPGRRYLIRGGHVMSMDPAVGDFAVADVLVAVRYADSQGAVREVGRRVGELPPGQATRFATGLGPFTSSQQFEVGVTGARVARND